MICILQTVCPTAIFNFIFSTFNFKKTSARAYCKLSSLIRSRRHTAVGTLPINLFFDFVKGYTVFFGNVFGIAYTLRRSDENLERTLSVFDTCYQTFNLAVALYGCVHLVKIASQIVHMGIKNRPCAEISH